MNPIQMINQIQKSKNPQAIMNNLIGNDANKQQMWQLAQQIANSGMNKQQMLETACKQSGADINQITSILSQFGINIK